MISDSKGQAFRYIEYTPYGEQWFVEDNRMQGPVGVGVLEYGFTDHLHDEETGLIYANARYLDPKTSRWMSTDPAMGEYLGTGDDLPAGGVFTPLNLQTYHYAGNNPIIYRDPTGRYDVDYFTSPQYEEDKAKLLALQSTPEFQAALEKQREENHQQLVSFVGYLRGMVNSAAYGLGALGAVLYYLSLAVAPATEGSSIIIGTAAAYVLEALASGLFGVDAILAIVDEYLQINSPMGQKVLITTVKELDEENAARKRNIKRLEGLRDAETDEKEKANIQKDIDLANEDLAKKEQERDAIASKVTDKSTIEE